MPPFLAFLAFLVGLATPFALIAYSDYRRKVRVEAWQDIINKRRRIPLCEELRLQGVYDQPEV
jgi:hypothetical protein